MRLAREYQQDGQDSGSQDRDLHRSVSDVTHNRLRHEQLPLRQKRIDVGRTLASSAHHQRP